MTAYCQLCEKFFSEKQYYEPYARIMIEIIKGEHARTPRNPRRYVTMKYDICKKCYETKNLGFVPKEFFDEIAKEKQKEEKQLERI